MVDYILPPQFVFSRIAEGNAYLVPSLMSIPATSSRNVHIRNPHSDKIMWLGAMKIIAEGSCEFYSHDTFESITDGDEITIQNALMDSAGGAPDTGPFEAYQDSTFSSITPYPVGFTTTAGPAQSKFIEVVSSAIEPGREMVIEIENKDNNSNKALFATLVFSSY